MEDKGKHGDEDDGDHEDDNDSTNELFYDSLHGRWSIIREHNIKLYSLH